MAATKAPTTPTMPRAAELARAPLFAAPVALAEVVALDDVPDLTYVQ